PAPFLSDEQRGRIHDSARAICREAKYSGAGTVEFLVGNDGVISFLEVNTRLQVEHPVTEQTSGIDLVREQLHIAEGGVLPFRDPPPLRGHAIEVRLYAEDPVNRWLPSAGTLHRFSVPGVLHSFGPLPVTGLRLDSGVSDGSVVGVHYDPMLAKLIAWGESREEAARLLSAALARARIHGVVTNRDLLVRVLRHPSFLVGDTDTGFLDAHPEVFAPLLAGADAARLSCLAAALAGSAARSASSSLPSGWRNVPSAPQTVAFEGPNGCVEVGYRLDRSGALAEWSVRTVDRDGVGLPGAGPDRSAPPDRPPVAIVSAVGDRVVLDVSGLRLTYSIHRVGDVSYVDGSEGSVTLTEVPRFPPPTLKMSEGSLVAPLPGTVGQVLVVPGQRVAAGDLLLTLEAMKLEHAVHAPAAGVVADVHVGPGSQVQTGTLLAVLAPD
ncbi:MAG: putative acetyl/propionyl-CoA carboxylase alpha subunit, partial [Dactylosporangium sp.]|nr:putative acetyl/propionyl-CoA carboxylase alpha subunit [Dactylosporangium sp.]